MGQILKFSGKIFLKNYLIFSLAIIIYLVHFLFFHGGYIGYDDLEYIKCAAAWNQGDFSHTSLYCFRYTSVAPLFLSYKLFGINDFSNFIYSFVIFLFLLLILLSVLRNSPATVRWIASGFLIFSPLHLLFMEKPMADIVVELGFFLSFATYFYIRFSGTKFRYDYIFWSIGIIIAFLGKESILIFYHYFVFLFVLDLYNKQRIEFWKKSALFLFVFGILYLLFNQILLGNALARAYIILDSQYMNKCSYDVLPLSALMKRISYELWDQLIRKMYLLPIALIPVLLFNKDKKIIFLSYSFLGLLLLANFMSISYNTYVPLCPDPRHFMHLLPVSALIMGYGIDNINKSIPLKRILLSIALLLIMLSVSIYMKHEDTWFLYIPVTAGIILGYSGKKRMMVLFVLAGLFSVFVQEARYSTILNYREQKKLNDFVINNDDPKKIVVTDRVNYGFGLVHSEFDTTSVKFVRIQDFDYSSMNDSIPHYLIKNGMTIYFSSFKWDTAPEYFLTAEEKLPVVYKNEIGTVFRLNPR